MGKRGARTRRRSRRGKAARIYEPEEIKKALAAAPAGETLSDVLPLDLMTSVDKDARYYMVGRGWTENAKHLVPLVGMARKVIKRAAPQVNGTGPLFPKLPVSKSTRKRGGSFALAGVHAATAQRVGDQTDGALALHALRHTWATAARRAVVDE